MNLPQATPPYICSIVPPYIVREISERGSPRQRARALQALAISERFRGRREAIGSFAAATPAGKKRRTIYDAHHRFALPGKLVRGEGDPPSKDSAVNEAYTGSGNTYDFYENVFGRNSIDNQGMRLDSSVHYGVDYDNAFWNGTQMVYGDGDGDLFNRFTRALDVIGHELTHGVTEHEAGLLYQGQPGALNESFSDIFGILVKQYKRKQRADRSNWIIGEGLFTSRVNGKGIRSMKAPALPTTIRCWERIPSLIMSRKCIRGRMITGASISTQVYRIWPSARPLWKSEATPGQKPGESGTWHSRSISAALQILLKPPR